MLKYLRIKNYAIVDDLSLELKDKLTVITGETGAGKSILIGAIAFLLGEKVTQDIIQTNKDYTRVEGVFSLQPENPVFSILKDSGIEIENDEIIITRELKDNNRSRYWINGSPALSSLISRISEHLIDLHGQHEQQSLLKVDYHREILDNFGNLLPLTNSLSKKFDEYLSLINKLKQLEEKRKAFQKDKELFKYQIQEIERARLKKDEDIILEEELQKLSNIEKLIQDCNEIDESLYTGDKNIFSELSYISKKIKSLGEFNPDFIKYYDEISQFIVFINEFISELRKFRNTLDFDPQKLQIINDRLTEIKRLTKKYNGNIEYILDLLEKMKKIVSESDTFEEEEMELAIKVDLITKDMSNLAYELHKKRIEVSNKFKIELEKALSPLGLDKAIVEIDIKTEENENGPFIIDGKKFNGSNYGIDRIEILFSANPGEKVKPLTSIISGGELSRVMLAIKSISPTANKVPILTFDEIDSGIGGSIAQAVGSKLSELAKNRQIIVITHLPQIASLAKNHIKVEKIISGNNTLINVSSLNENERVEEIARMLAGKTITEKTLEHAREMLEISKNK